MYEPVTAKQKGFSAVVLSRKPRNNPPPHIPGAGCRVGRIVPSGRRQLFPMTSDASWGKVPGSPAACSHYPAEAERSGRNQRSSRTMLFPDRWCRISFFNGTGRFPWCVGQLEVWPQTSRRRDLPPLRSPRIPETRCTRGCGLRPVTLRTGK